MASSCFGLDMPSRGSRDVRSPSRVFSRDHDLDGWTETGKGGRGGWGSATATVSSAHGILFGYFRADDADPGRNLPGQPVFTCLSHDIIVHETTHAIVDGIRGYFLEQTNVDVPGFHEAFADLAALFRHFSHREVLQDTIERTGGRLFDYQLKPDATTDAGASPRKKDGDGPLIAAQIRARNPLIEIAEQFGEASGLRRGLRSALGTPQSPEPIKRLMEPHARGSILVAAVFDAFFSTYVARTSDLFRIFRAAGGSATPIDLPGPQANQLCVPRIPLREALGAKCTLLRSDQIAAKVAGKSIPAAEGSPGSLPSPKVGAVAAGACWIDYSF